MGKSSRLGVEGLGAYEIAILEGAISILLEGKSFRHSPFLQSDRYLSQVGRYQVWILSILWLGYAITVAAPSLYLGWSLLSLFVRKEVIDKLRRDDLGILKGNTIGACDKDSYRREVEDDDRSRIRCWKNYNAEERNAVNEF